MSDKLHVASLGVDAFDRAFSETETPFVRLDWRPPAQGRTDLVDILFKLETKCVDDEGNSLIDKANREALQRVIKGQPVVKRFRPAHECIPGMTKTSIFHAGPPIHWDNMCGPMRGAYVGALKYEGLAATDSEAEDLMASGKITYGPNHPNKCVGPMTGMISHSMPLWVVENEAFGNTAYCTMNEGIGKVMRFGANGPEVIDRLKWIETVMAPVVDEALVMVGGINLKNIAAQSLAMGDEMHQRNVAASLNCYKAFAAELAKVAAKVPTGPEVIEFIVKKNEQFFLNLAMAMGKALMDPMRGIEYSTMISCMSRNGVNFGINISALGDTWFEAPCLNPQALYFPGYSEDDANPDMGDSAIVECYGIGGFAMGSAPAVVRFVGAGTLQDALDFTTNMGRITVGPNPDLPMPNMDFAGVPTGIDIRKVVETGILPVINTGVAHKQAGIGQIGAGIVTPPMDIMVQALEAFAKKYV
ncbi:DUF1116 domain-containing protein [Desulfovibrio sp. OttesenSCG-928-O18]|nr:DUF1116 domain-containing protein [Desulfovibrio sp. OttesenSCG-928-O18]